MNLPTPYMLKVRRYSTDGKDGHGNPKVSYSDPGDDWKVHGWASGVNEEPDQRNRDLSMVLWTVYAPISDNLPGRLDLVTLNGVDYAVEGVPRDYSHDPFGHHVGGAVVYLKATEG